VERHESKAVQDVQPQAQAHSTVEGGGPLPPPPRAHLSSRARLPVVVIIVASCTNIAVYGVEWCLYALYFRERYNWGGAWSGFAQMIGDIIGATVLGLSTASCVVACAGHGTLPRPLRSLLRPPFGVSTCLLANSIFFLLLAQPAFGVSLAGQVLMGTAYVFNEQLLQEMLLLYARGDHAVYRRLVVVHFAAFTVGCALCASVAFGLYGMGGFASAFYTTAAAAALVGLGFGAFYAWRLAPTSGGVLGSLKEAEDELASSPHATGCRCGC
jgi:hypothetical protein